MHAWGASVARRLSPRSPSRSRCPWPCWGRRCSCPCAFSAPRGPAAPTTCPDEVIVGYRAGAVETPAQARFGVRSSTPAATPDSRVLQFGRGESVSAAIARLRRQRRRGLRAPQLHRPCRRRFGARRLLAGRGGPARRKFYPDDGGRTKRAGAGSRCSGTSCRPRGSTRRRRGRNLLADHRAGGRGVVIAVLDTGVAYRDWKQFPSFARLRPHALRLPLRLRGQQQVSARPQRPRHVRRRDPRRVDQQRHRAHRTGLRRLDHARPRARRRRQGRRGHDRARHPLRGHPWRPGHQPQPGVPAQPGQRRSRDPPDRQRDRLRPPPRA